MTPNLCINAMPQDYSKSPIHSKSPLHSKESWVLPLNKHLMDKMRQHYCRCAHMHTFSMFLQVSSFCWWSHITCTTPSTVDSPLTEYTACRGGVPQNHCRLVLCTDLQCVYMHFSGGKCTQARRWTGRQPPTPTHVRPQRAATGANCTAAE